MQQCSQRRVQLIAGLRFQSPLRSRGKQAARRDKTQKKSRDIEAGSGSIYQYYKYVLGGGGGKGNVRKSSSSTRRKHIKGPDLYFATLSFQKDISIQYLSLMHLFCHYFCPSPFLHFICFCSVNFHFPVSFLFLPFYFKFNPFYCSPFHIFPINYTSVFHTYLTLVRGRYRYCTVWSSDLEYFVSVGSIVKNECLWRNTSCISHLLCKNELKIRKIWGGFL